MIETSLPIVTALERGPSGDFRELACRYLEEYLSKIRASLERLDDGSSWWRPGPASNSIANLLLHLDGNLSLWILHGLGGEPNRRQRSLEFSARDGAPTGQLEEALRRTVLRCVEVIRGLDPSELDTVRQIQGYSVDGLGVVFHAVEHMSYHTGQIVSMAKALLEGSEPLEFYPRHRDE